MRIVIICLLLCSCSKTVYSPEFERGIEVCQNNKKLDHIERGSTVTAYCRDGTVHYNIMRQK